MLNTRRFLAALVTLAAGLTVTLSAPSAEAATSSDGDVSLTTRVNSSVSANTCGNAASYRVGVNLSRIAAAYDAQDLDWTADINITGPHGYLSSDYVWASSSWQGIFICEWPSYPGTYTVTADITVDGFTYDAADGGYYNYDSSLYTRTIRQSVVLKSASSITASRAKYARHSWKTTSALRVGGKVAKGRYVKLQRKSGTHWATVATRKTGATGKASAIVKGRAGSFRWYYPGNSTAYADGSGTFHLPRR